MVVDIPKRAHSVMEYRPDQIAPNRKFGVVSWCDDDIIEGLQARHKAVTEEHIAAVRSELEKHWFTDAMIEAGWQYMYATISDLFWDEDEVTQ